MNNSDQRLIRSLKKGKKRVLKLLYDAHSIRIFNLAYRITSNREDAEEVVQDTFVKLWKFRSGIDTEKNILGYIIVIARNLAIDVLKSRSKRIETENNEGLILQKLSENNNFYFEEAARQFDAAIAQLPPKRREVFILKIHTNLTNKEIASKLNISETMVEKQMRLASSILREIMNSDE
ncbi:sigma-70 family RNA polymerase sigma factor [Reichenbachiella sp. MALMAid0571]|uniref:RNA polymerase sigma factor n=1 Tax=Reichenbachiella sp. MALMAid0571 TaxID=3143939 RepID=UPI0032DF8193